MAGWFFFSVLDAFTKLYTQEYSVIQLLAMSSTVGTTLSGSWILYKYGWRGFITPNWKLFFIRGLMILFGAYCTLSAISRISLSDFYGIVFMSPFIITILSALLLKEKIGLHRILALIGGFIGVLVLIGPHLESEFTGMLFAFAGMTSASIAAIVIRKIGREKVTTLFAFVPFLSNVLVYPALMVTLPGNIHIPDNPWMLIGPLMMGALAFAGFMFYSYGLTRASETAVVAPFHYTQMIWGVLFGFFMFRDVPSINTIIGSAVILSAGLYLLWREYVQHKINHSSATIVTASAEVTLPEDQISPAQKD